jgi:hypothetical protein
VEFGNNKNDIVEKLEKQTATFEENITKKNKVTKGDALLTAIKQSYLQNDKISELNNLLPIIIPLGEEDERRKKQVTLKEFMGYIKLTKVSNHKLMDRLYSLYLEDLYDEIYILSNEQLSLNPFINLEGKPFEELKENVFTVVDLKNLVSKEVC